MGRLVWVLLLFLAVSAFAGPVTEDGSIVNPAPDPGDNTDLSNCTDDIFYVNNDTGADANPGTLSNPFKSVSHTSTLSLTPGDCVLHARGSVWVDQHTDWEDSPSGTAANPIIYGSYGNGARPIIRYTSSHPSLSTDGGIAHVRWERLQVEGADAWRVRTGSHHLAWHHVRLLNVWTTGWAVWRSDTGTSPHNLEWIGSSCENTAVFAGSSSINGVGECWYISAGAGAAVSGESQYDDIENILIRDCYATDARNEPISIKSGVVNATVEGCLVEGNSRDDDPGLFNSGNSDDANNNIVFRGNVVRNNTNTGGTHAVMLMGPGTTAYNNIIYNNSGADCFDGESSTFFYHNTCYQNGAGFRGSTSIPASNVKNNIGDDAIADNIDESAGLFENAGDDNFKLAGGSAALDLYSNCRGVTNDIIGTSRPQNTNCDAGAIEFTEEEPPPPPGDGPVVSHVETAISSGDQTAYATGDFAVAGDDIVLTACVYNVHGSNDTDTGGVTWNTNEAFTLLAQQGDGATEAGTHSLWYLTGPTATTANIDIALDAAATSVATIMVLTGASQSAPTLSATGASTQLTLGANLTTTVDNTLLLSCVGSGATTETWSYGTGQFERSDVSNPSGSGISQSSSTELKETAGLETLTHTRTSTNSARMVVAGIQAVGLTMAALDSVSFRDTSAFDVIHNTFLGGGIEFQSGGNANQDTEFDEFQDNLMSGGRWAGSANAEITTCSHNVDHANAADPPEDCTDTITTNPVLVANTLCARDGLCDINPTSASFLAADGSDGAVRGALVPPVLTNAVVNNTAPDRVLVTVVPHAVVDLGGQGYTWNTAPIRNVDITKIICSGIPSAICVDDSPAMVVGAVVVGQNTLELALETPIVEGESLDFEAAAGWCTDSASLGGIGINAQCLGVSVFGITNNVQEAPVEVSTGDRSGGTASGGTFQ